MHLKTGNECFFWPPLTSNLQETVQTYYYLFIGGPKLQMIRDNLPAAWHICSWICITTIFLRAATCTACTYSRFGSEIPKCMKLTDHLQWQWLSYHEFTQPACLNSITSLCVRSGHIYTLHKPIQNWELMVLRQWCPTFNRWPPLLLSVFNFWVRKRMATTLQILLVK